MTENAPVRQSQTSAERGADGLHCITQDPREPVPPAFLAVCDDDPVDVVAWVFCPAECGGHPICGPCLALCREEGGVR